MCERRCPWEGRCLQSIRSSGASITAGCGTPDVGIGNGTQGLCKKQYVLLTSGAISPTTVTKSHTGNYQLDPGNHVDNVYGSLIGHHQMPNISLATWRHSVWVDPSVC